jgi:hypothetical protein
MNSRNVSLNFYEGSDFSNIQDFNNPGNPFWKWDHQNYSNVNNTSFNEDEKILYISKDNKNAINDKPSLMNTNKNFIKKNENKILEIDKEKVQSTKLSQKHEEFEREKKSQKINKKAKLAIEINYIDITNLQTQKIEVEDTPINEEAISQNNKNRNSRKFCYANIMKRINTLILGFVRDFINQKLIKIYKNIGNGIKIKKLFVNQKRKEKENIKYYREFMNKTIGEIFSCEISKRNTNFDKNKNRILIEELRNEKDLNKKIYFEKLFNLSFLDCLEHIMEQKNIDVLKGIKLFSEFKNDPAELRKKKFEPNYYLPTFENVLKEYVKKLYIKNPRKRANNEEKDG